MQGDDFSYITDNTYSKREILAMEEVVWGGLNFELTVPTARTFLRRFLKASAADWPPSHVWRWGFLYFTHLTHSQLYLKGLWQSLLHPLRTLCTCCWQLQGAAGHWLPT